MYGDIERERERFMEKALGEAVLVTAQERRGGRVRARGRAQAAGFSRGGRAEPCRGREWQAIYWRGQAESREPMILMTRFLFKRIIFTIQGELISFLRDSSCFL